MSKYVRCSKLQNQGRCHFLSFWTLWSFRECSICPPWSNLGQRLWDWEKWDWKEKEVPPLYGRRDQWSRQDVRVYFRRSVDQGIWLHQDAARWAGAFQQIVALDRQWLPFGPACLPQLPRVHEIAWREEVAENLHRGTIFQRFLFLLVHAPSIKDFFKIRSSREKTPENGFWPNKNKKMERWPDWVSFHRRLDEAAPEHGIRFEPWQKHLGVLFLSRSQIGLALRRPSFPGKTHRLWRLVECRKLEFRHWPRQKVPAALQLSPAIKNLRCRRPLHQKMVLRTPERPKRIHSRHLEHEPQRPKQVRRQAGLSLSLYAPWHPVPISRVSPKVLGGQFSDAGKYAKKVETSAETETE